MGAGWLVGGMERAEDRALTVKLRCTPAAGNSWPRDSGCEPGADADPTRQIVQPTGDPKELSWTRNSAGGNQEPESAIGHGSAEWNGYGKGSQCARGDWLVAGRIVCVVFAGWSLAWRPSQLKRTFQFGAFQRPSLDQFVKRVRAAFWSPFSFWLPNLVRYRLCPSSSRYLSELSARAEMPIRVWFSKRPQACILT